MRAIVDNTPVEYWARDTEGRCIMENALIVEHWGSLLGKRPQDTDLDPGGNGAVATEQPAGLCRRGRRSRSRPLGQGAAGLQQCHRTDQGRWTIIGIVGFNQDITDASGTRKKSIAWPSTTR
jgi:PAS domain-containing protein